MIRVVAVDLPAGPEFVTAVADIWASGDVVFPVDRRVPAPERASVMSAIRPTHVWDGGGLRPMDDGRPGESGDALIIATSGTTGVPKGVVLTATAVAAAVEITDGHLGTDPDRDHWLLALPPAHIGGFSVIARAVLRGTAITALPRFEPAAVDRVDATLTALVPTALRRIDPTRFRAILLGGSAIPPDRPPNTIATYGLTESCGGIVYDRTPLPGVEIRIVDDEVHLRGPTLLRGYRSGEDPKTPDGWLPTGDLGSLADGHLRVEGRRDDVIITGGQKVWPNRVEEVIRRLPGVADIAVVGRPDPEWGAIVTAALVPDDTSEPPSLDTIRGQVKRELPAYMAPHRLELRASLPRTALGKIRRREV